MVDASLLPVHKQPVDDAQLQRRRPRSQLVSSIAGLTWAAAATWIFLPLRQVAASRQGGALLPGETPRMLRGSLVALAAASGATAVRTNATVGCKVTLDGAKAAQW